MDKKVLLPGEHVGPGEVVSESSTTYVMGDEVYSSSVGELDKDGTKVVAKKNKSMLGNGMVVVGIVLIEADTYAVIGAIDGKGVVSEDGKLLVSNVSQGYLKSMRDALRIGDIVRAKVLKRESGSLYFTVSYPEYGVLKAFCTSCREPLELGAKEMLKCPSCGKVERRKVAKDYRSYEGINL